MNEITTATGKSFNCVHCVPHKPSNSVYFCIKGEEKETLEKVFSDPSETAVLTYPGQKYEGYTTLDYIEEEDDGVWKLRMKA